MKKSITIISVLFLIFLLVIGFNRFKMKDENYYGVVADTIIGFFRSTNYNKSDIRDEDIDALEAYLSTLTHENQIIDLSKYIVRQKAYYTSSANTKGVYKKDGKCYIKYDDLDFDKPVEETNYEMEPFKKVVCNHYFIVLYASDFYPEYSVTKKNPKYDYILQETNKKINGYEYIYYSTYDGTLLNLNLIIADGVIVSIEADFLGKDE